MDKEKLNIIRLIRSENLGIKTFENLVENFNTATKALEYLENRKSSLSKVKLASKESVEEELELLNQYGGKIIFTSDNNYPSNLLNIPDCPPFISVLGNVDLLVDKNKISIVGARNASFASIKFTEKVTKAICEKEFCTVSGMARGIDSVVHNSSLTQTIAILPAGIDQVYPLENQKLYERIQEFGCLIAENKFGLKPANFHFPLRNRIIAGMSLATIVIEASMKSGTLITARFAAEYGRDVHAVPGFPLDQNFAGNNFLIKNGAYLLDDINEVFNNLTVNLLHQERNLQHKKHSAKVAKIDLDLPDIKKDVKNLSDKILEKISLSPVDVDEISRYFGAPISIIQATILELELSGKIRRVGNNSIISTDLKEYVDEFSYC